MTERELLIEILSKPIYPHENVDPLEAVADYLLDNGVTLQRWIPVTERLPGETEDFVLVTDIENPHRMPRVVKRKAFTVTEYWGIAIGYYAHDQKVTHWMPLPTPPKEE